MRNTYHTTSSSSRAIDAGHYSAAIMRMWTYCNSHSQGVDTSISFHHLGAHEASVRLYKPKSDENLKRICGDLPIPRSRYGSGRRMISSPRSYVWLASLSISSQRSPGYSLCSIDLVLSLPISEIVLDRVTQLPTFVPSATSVNGDYDVLQRTGDKIMPVMRVGEADKLRARPPVAKQG